jgi:hypothetical protein
MEKHKRDGAIVPVNASNVTIRPSILCFANVITGEVTLPKFQAMKVNLLSERELEEKIE